MNRFIKQIKKRVKQLKIWVTKRLEKLHQKEQKFLQTEKILSLEIEQGMLVVRGKRQIT